MDLLTLIAIGLIAILIYFLPALIANRRHPHATAIAIVNLFLGWTFIGWVACLVWAFINVDQRREETGES